MVSDYELVDRDGTIIGRYRDGRSAERRARKLGLRGYRVMLAPHPVDRVEYWYAVPVKMDALDPAWWQWLDERRLTADDLSGPVDCHLSYDCALFRDKAEAALFRLFHGTDGSIRQSDWPMCILPDGTRVDARMYCYMEDGTTVAVVPR